MNEQFEIRTQSKKAAAFCIVAVVAVLLATLWPYNPFPRNGVTWLQATGGLKFEKAGLVKSNKPLKPPENQSTESYSLELLVRPASTKSVHTILAFYATTRAKQLSVVQYEDGLLVTHDATIESDRTKTIKFGVDHVFRSGTLVFVAISSGPNGTKVYLDGQPVAFFPAFKISGSELAAKIVLGTSPVTYAPWLGELRGLAIYAKQLTPAEVLRDYREWNDPSGPPELIGAMARYAFAERAGREVGNAVPCGPHLEIPAMFSVPYKDLLRSATRDFNANFEYAKDVLMNIAGFVPLGLIVGAYLVWTRSRWKAILITTSACGFLSFAIEVLQYYIPRRGSGTTDIITNTLGAALGAALTDVGPVRKALERMKLIPKTSA